MSEGLLAGIAYVDILPEFSKFAGEARAEMAKAASGVEGEASKAFAGIGKAATLAVVGAASAIAVASIEMADKFEAQHARLESALHNIGTSFEAEKPHVAALDQALERLGFTNTETEGSLSSLVLVTKNSGKAITDMHLAADIARGRHIDLAAATQLLVKVESGHVSLLGRLGINTKDATGATISQEEAIKRLSALYGGNAQAYTETFAGKMQVLRATSEDLAKNIGLRLIPIIETLATDTLHAVQWLEKHRAVAYTLGAVIGGPLVAAMATYVALQAKALAMNVVGFFSSIADGAAAAIGPLLGLDSAVAGIGITELGIAAPAAAAGLGALALGAAAVVVPLAAVAGGIYLLNRGTNESAESAKRWADHFVAQAVRTGNAAKQIAVERDNYQRRLDALDAGNASATMARDHLSQTERVRQFAYNKQHLDALNAAWKHHQEVVSKAAKDEARDHAAASKAIVVGEEAASKAATDAGKKYAKALSDVAAAVGPSLAAIDQAAGFSTDQLKNIAKESNATANAITSSFDSSTSVVQAFAGKVDISFKDVNKFFKDQITEAKNWSDNLKKLAAAGIDQGLLQQLAEAGPKSAPLVTALLNDVKAGNLNAINQSQTDLRGLLNGTIDLVNGYANSFYATGQSNGNAYANGFNSAALNAHAGALQPGSGTKHAKALPAYAAGGFIDHPMIISAGEQSRREVVLPLEDPARSFELLAQSGLFDQHGATAAAGHGFDISPAVGGLHIENLNVQVPHGADKTQAGREILAALDRALDGTGLQLPYAVKQALQAVR